MQLLGFTSHAVAAGKEQVALAADQFFQIGVACARLHQLFFKDHFVCLVALGLQPSTAGHQFVKLAFDDRQLRAGLPVIQRQQQIACLDGVAFLYRDFGDNTAGRMLYDLAVAVDLDPARSDDRPGDVGLRRPQGKTTEQDDQAEQAEQNRGARAPCFFRGLGHAIPPARRGACVICWWF